MRNLAANAQPASPPQASQVAAKAAVRAADLLGMTSKDLSAVIGTSEAGLSRLRRGSSVTQLSGKPYELALLFIRLYRSLDAIAGGDDATSRHWLRTPNTALGGIPLDRIKTVEGLGHVLAYLDARRAPV